MQSFYETIANSDAEGLFTLLTDNFVGAASAGMPHEVGGEHRGPDDMIGGVWGRIAALYDVDVDATFAHVITTRDDRIAALHPITDTAQWRIPCR